MPDATPIRPMTDQPPRLDLVAFQEEGYLAEVNRQALHPLGLALAIQLPGRLGRLLRRRPRLVVLDDRSDPEGWYFAPHPVAYARLRAVAEERHRRAPARHDALGYLVQPIITVLPDDAGEVLPPGSLGEA